MKNNKKFDRTYLVISVISTILLFIAVLAYLFNFVFVSERVFIIFIFSFGIELGLRMSKLLGV